MAFVGSDVPVQPAANADFQGQRTQSIVASRNHVEISPKYGGQFRAGNIIRLEIPSNDWLDSEAFYISFKAKIFTGLNASSNGIVQDPNVAANVLVPLLMPNEDQPPLVFGNSEDAAALVSGVQNIEPGLAQTSLSVRFANNIQTIFNRMKILQGSTVIEDIQDYGTLAKIISYASIPSEYRDKVGLLMSGDGDPSDYLHKCYRKKWHCKSRNDEHPGAHFYNVRLHSGLFTAGKLLPLKYMGQLTIELYLETNQESLVSSVSGRFSTLDRPFVAVGNASLTTAINYPNAYYELDEVKAHCEFVTTIDEYDKNAQATIEERGLEIWIDTWSTHSRQIHSAGVSTHSFQERAVSLRGGFAVMRNSEDINDIRSEASFPANNIREWQWKLGSKYVPAQPVKTVAGGGRAMAELYKTLGALWDVNHTGLIQTRNYLPEIPTCANSTHNIAVQNNRTYDNTAELQWENSLPNLFFFPLTLMKEDGQLGGFNTAATNVDVELKIDLKAHNELTGYSPHPNTSTWDVANTYLGKAHVFQPSKYRVLDTSLDRVGGNGALSIQLGDSREYNGEQIYFSGIRFAGWDPVAADSERSRLATVYGSGSTSSCFMQTKVPHTYSRLLFFANVDQVVRLARIGQLEVLR